jgi:hypothetical protein
MWDRITSAWQRFFGARRVKETREQDRLANVERNIDIRRQRRRFEKRSAPGR